MVSPELIRRYQFFAGLSIDQIAILARSGSEETAEAGYCFFREGEHLDYLYIVLEGEVALTIELPDQGKEITTSTTGPGEVFAWSALVPPHNSTANARAVTFCRVIAFDCRELWPAFEKDCRFGYLMMQKTAQVIRERLRTLRIETLAYGFE
jgi:CRP/FNR family cyclic AMP-dependent transcriptional regulator